MSAIERTPIATRTFHATCHCRASTLSFTVPTASLPLPVHFCHCGICRHATGTYFTAGASIPEPITDTSTFTAYESSDHLTRWFCSTCGAHLLANTPLGGATKWFVSAPSVDAEEDVWDFAGHVYVDSTGDGGLAALMTRIGGREVGLWDERSDRSAPWHQASTGSKSDAMKNIPDEQLHARCQCGGIEFYVSRPTGDETFTEIDEDNVRKHKDKWLAIHDVCNTCRLTISTFVVSWFFPSRNHITLTDGSSYPDDGLFGTARAYKSSAGVDRTFCGKCGAAVSYVSEERSNVVDVAVGLLRTDDARAEDWLEWRTCKLAFEKDACWQSVRDALKEGLQR
ncbi:uncharacterized protein EKO05_0010773 [Ascochyta rabiei]|uniref:uncharacterized protein n=1 Tax=Didymella rabiei TaxID=5454 RepID=UPI00220F9D12|nr:uncharacterized protein EKO05_0010773 [Ascochyta rabiei]UPX20544.1 hypothetical protein EKO05_0010773 [Ascochyta rabiei]